MTTGGWIFLTIAWTIIIVLPICAFVALSMVKEPAAVANEPRPSFSEVR